jgi:hypothetical protein
MNRFKHEKQGIFGDLRLSDEKKSAVLHGVKKKRSRWVPIGAAAAISVICLFFLMNGFRNDEGYSQAGAIAAYEKYLKEEMDDMHVDIQHVELPFDRKNDAIIIGIYDQGDSNVYYFQYMTYKDGEWTFGLSGAAGHQSNKAAEENISGTYVDYQDVNGDIIFAGMLKDDIDSIVVGEKKVKTFTINWDKIWIALAPSRGTPVYTVKDGEKKRVEQFSSSDFTTEPPIVYELVGNDYALSYDKDTMHVYGEEYTEFDIAVDPDYYDKNPFNYTDVVLIEGKDGPEVVRIQATNSMSSTGVFIKKEESTILINGMGILEPYGWARAKGYAEDYKASETVDYGQMGDDELFVHPDNWLSDGMQGYIKKEQVIGKVLGYSIADIKTSWSSAEMALYKDVKQRGYAAAKEAGPKEVARVQLYALLQEDYKTAHSVTSGISYERMKNYFNEIKHDNLKHFISYYALMVEKATFTESGEKLVVESAQSGKELFEWEMVRDGGWKVKFISTKY